MLLVIEVIIWMLVIISVLMRKEKRLRYNCISYRHDIILMKYACTASCFLSMVLYAIGYHCINWISIGYQLDTVSLYARV